MKKTFRHILILIFFCNYTYSQRITIKSIESKLITHQGVEFKGELKEKNNDLYAFPNWSNRGVIFVNNNEYYLTNLNFNISSNSFESRLNRDKIFSFNNESLDSIVINKLLFKKFNSTFYEVLFKKGDIEFLKKYDLEILAGSFNRLTGTTGSPKISVVYKYLIKTIDNFRIIEFNKNSILDLFNNEVEEEILLEFVENENLSFRKIEDFSKILEFIINNPSLSI